MRTAPDGKACVNNARVMIRVSMGMRAFHPSIASWGMRLGCLLRSLASLCDVALCAFGSMSAHVYEAHRVARFMDCLYSRGDAAAEFYYV